MYFEEVSMVFIETKRGILPLPWHFERGGNAGAQGSAKNTRTNGLVATFR